MKSREKVEERLGLHKTRAPAGQEKMDGAYLDLSNLLEELQVDIEVYQALLQLWRCIDYHGEGWGWIHALEWVLDGTN